MIQELERVALAIDLEAGDCDEHYLFDFERGDHAAPNAGVR